MQCPKGRNVLPLPPDHYPPRINLRNRSLRLHSSCQTNIDHVSPNSHSPPLLTVGTIPPRDMRTLQIVYTSFNAGPGILFFFLVAQTKLFSCSLLNQVSCAHQPPTRMINPNNEADINLIANHSLSTLARLITPRPRVQLVGTWSDDIEGRRD